MRGFLRRIDVSLRIDIVAAADGGILPAGVGLETYDGVTMTGSALNVYNGGDPVTRQIRTREGRLCRPACRSFGSCWDCKSR